MAIHKQETVTEIGLDLQFIRAKESGHAIAEHGFQSVPVLVRRAAGEGNYVARMGLIKGFSEGLAELLFPLPKHPGNRTLTIQTLGAEVDYAHKAEEILTSYVRRARILQAGFRTPGK